MRCNNHGLLLHVEHQSPWEYVHLYTYTHTQLYAHVLGTLVAQCLSPSDPWSVGFSVEVGWRWVGCMGWKHFFLRCVLVQGVRSTQGE